MHFLINLDNPAFTFMWNSSVNGRMIIRFYTMDEIRLCIIQKFFRVFKNPLLRTTRRIPIIICYVPDYVNFQNEDK